MPGVTCSSPQGCYLVFPNIENTPYTAEELHHVLLQEAKVAVVPGMPKWFGAGAQGHIRLSFATSEEILSEGLSRIKRFLTK
jgi:bifunctional pyridoxal-dependent enzyme with beta-cystathionase and maltose regulon repressor activities